MPYGRLRFESLSISLSLDDIEIVTAKDEDLSSQYTMKVMLELLTQAQLLGINTEEFIEFLGNQVQAMIRVSPNYNYYGRKSRIWIMRGYYPETPLFFKMIVLEKFDKKYYVKVTPMRVTANGKRGSFDTSILIEGTKIEKMMTDKMENILLGADHKIERVGPWIHVPRCMSPSGCKIFKFKKPSKKKKKKNDTQKD